ncbi:hypothetical protein ACFX2F_004498 [Malus domestica]
MGNQEISVRDEGKGPYTKVQGKVCLRLFRHQDPLRGPSAPVSLVPHNLRKIWSSNHSSLQRILSESELEWSPPVVARIELSHPAMGVPAFNLHLP